MSFNTYINRSVIKDSNYFTENIDCTSLNNDYIPTINLRTSEIVGNTVKKLLYGNISSINDNSCNTTTISKFLDNVTNWSMYNTYFKKVTSSSVGDNIYGRAGQIVQKLDDGNFIPLLLFCVKKQDLDTIIPIIESVNSHTVIIEPTKVYIFLDIRLSLYDNVKLRDYIFKYCIDKLITVGNNEHYEVLYTDIRNACYNPHAFRLPEFNTLTGLHHYLNDNTNIVLNKLREEVIAQRLVVPAPYVPPPQLPDAPTLAENGFRVIDDTVSTEEDVPGLDGRSWSIDVNSIPSDISPSEVIDLMMATHISPITINNPTMEMTSRLVIETDRAREQITEGLGIPAERESEEFWDDDEEYSEERIHSENDDNSLHRPEDEGLPF